MKATINGIAVEGSPQEIAEYLKRMDDMRRDGVHIKPPLGQIPDYIKQQTQVPEWLKKQMYIGTPYTYNNSNCLAATMGGCNCTGACKN